jgi:hypothetical protein
LHRAYDDHELDLLPYLEAHGLRAELGHAVTHLGLIGALQRITNVGWAPVSDGRLPAAAMSRTPDQALQSTPDQGVEHVRG